MIYCEDEREDISFLKKSRKREEQEYEIEVDDEASKYEERKSKGVTVTIANFETPAVVSCRLDKNLVTTSLYMAALLSLQRCGLTMH